MKKISELALDTISELDRRGWTRGALGRTHELVKDENGKPVHDENGVTRIALIGEEDCKVCLLGAMSSAYNPYHPFEPGYNDPKPDDTFDEEYEKFTKAVAAELGTNIQEYAEQFPTTKSYGIPNINDQLGYSEIGYADEADEHAVAKIKAALNRVAEKYAALGQ